MQSPAKLLLRLVGAVLGMGAVGCTGQHGGPVYGITPLYGTPRAEFKLSGTVLDSTTQAPVPGIALTFQDSTVTSDEKGAFALDVTTTPWAATGGLAAKDIDGASNGSYVDQVVPLSPTQTAPGDGAFNAGVLEQKGITVALVAKP